MENNKEPVPFKIFSPEVGDSMELVIALYAGMVILSAMQTKDDGMVKVTIYSAPDENGEMNKSNTCSLPGPFPLDALTDEDSLSQMMEFAMPFALEKFGWGEYFGKLLDIPPEKLTYVDGVLGILETEEA